MSNLFADLPPASNVEQLVELLSRPGLRIERIVSAGQASPPGFWYDQPQGEWVLVLEGEARLALDNEPAPRLLKKGDFVDIAPHRRHRVESTATPTVSPDEGEGTKIVLMRPLDASTRRMLRLKESATNTFPEPSRATSTGTFNHAVTARMPSAL